MRFISTFISTLLLITAGTVQAANKTHKTNQTDVIVVQVGVNSSLVFKPSSVKAKPGDIIEFQFHQKNHSVIQSSFEAPCAPISSVQSNVTGFDSGFQPVAADATEFPVFSIKVNDTNPIWASCSQVGHCAKGMVFAVNPPSNGTQTFKNFRSLAVSGKAAASSSAVARQSASASPSAGVAAAASSSTTASPAKTGDGVKALVNLTLVMLLAVLGGAFIVL